MLVAVPELLVVGRPDDPEQGAAKDDPAGTLPTRQLDGAFGDLAGLKAGGSLPGVLTYPAQARPHQARKLELEKALRPLGLLLMPSHDGIVAGLSRLLTLGIDHLRRHPARRPGSASQGKASSLPRIVLDICARTPALSGTKCMRSVTDFSYGAKRCPAWAPTFLSDRQ